MFGLMEFQQPPSISDLANKLKGNRMRWTSSRMQGSRSLAEFVCYFLFFLKHHVVLLKGNDFRKICFRRPPKMFRLLSLTNYPITWEQTQAYPPCNPQLQVWQFFGTLWIGLQFLCGDKQRKSLAIPS